MRGEFLLLLEILGFGFEKWTMSPNETQGKALYLG